MIREVSGERYFKLAFLKMIVDRIQSVVWQVNGQRNFQLDLLKINKINRKISWEKTAANGKTVKVKRGKKLLHNYPFGMVVTFKSIEVFSSYDRNSNNSICVRLLYPSLTERSLLKY